MRLPLSLKLLSDFDFILFMAFVDLAVCFTLIVAEDANRGQYVSLQSSLDLAFKMGLTILNPQSKVVSGVVNIYHS